MHSFSLPQASRLLTALVCGFALLAAGCHRNNQTSGYGVAWVTLTDQPGDFSSYIVNVSSVTLTRTDSAVVTALATVEQVDFTKLTNIAELWGTATIPTGTYTSASIVVDYTSAVITVPVNGVPQKATVVGPTGAAVTTVTINVLLDPANPLVVTPTYATTAAQRLAIDFNLAASTSSVNLTTNPVTVTVKPYMTAAISAPDNKLIRVRGPLINSSVNLNTYTVYVRPFHDVVSSLGLLTLFPDTTTVYQLNGLTYVGQAGINALSKASAGSTITAAYATYEPTATPSATAAIWHPKYILAGSTLEDNYTQGLEGDVIARSGNTLTLRGSTLALMDGTLPTYNVTDATVYVGPSTIVTADGNATLTGLNYNSIAVGQHVVARGIYSLPASVVTIDATATNGNAGSVRLVPTSIFGSVLSATAGSTLLNLETIDNWPVTNYNFAGNGAAAATDTNAASFSVYTGALDTSMFAAGTPFWSDGLFAPFGSAPPDFNAGTVSAQAAVPASLRAVWTSPGAGAPFSLISGSSMTLDLANANLASAIVRIGAESIDLQASGSSPTIVPQTGVGTAGVPATFQPLFAVGNPTTAAPGGISVFSVFGTFVTTLTTVLGTSPALQFEARGVYDAAANTFSASSINVVL